jgi:hypothetical protein
VRRKQQLDEDQGADEFLLQEYEHFISGKAEGTIDAYVRTTRQVMARTAQCPGNGGRFYPRQFTKTAVEVYLASLKQEGFRLNYRARVKSTISSFARWLMQERGLLQRNPTKGITFLHSKCLLLVNSRKIRAIFYAHGSSRREIGAEVHSEGACAASASPAQRYNRAHDRSAAAWRAPCPPCDPGTPPAMRSTGKKYVTFWRLTSPGALAILSGVGCAVGGSTLLGESGHGERLQTLLCNFILVL